MGITVSMNIGIGDVVSAIILLLTFIALIWYSLETRALRQWQKRQVQSTLLSMDIQRVMNHAKHPSVRIPYSKPWPTIMREIYELGKFDLNDLHSSSDYEPLSRLGKAWNKIKSIWKSIS